MRPDHVVIVFPGCERRSRMGPHERGTPFSNRGFQAMVERAARAAGFNMKIHPHMLRHSCGYKLANDGVDTRTIQTYLGHKSIQHTVRYTELAPTRFKSLFRD
jgi:site-specific recombinase XerD